MNKSISISLGGLSFFIEEDAFHKLQKYLEDVKLSLETEEEDKKEILQDVEARIAELFKEWLGNFRQVIDSKDVDKVISIMGTPEQYQSEIGEKEYEFEKESGANETTEKNKFYQRQLFRDMDDKMIAGVCSGLAHFFGIQPVWFRLGLVLLILLSSCLFHGVVSLLFLIYFILWIVTPKASTTSEKLKMKGKPVNFDSIKEYINKDEISEQANKIKNKFSKANNEIRDFLESFFKILTRLITLLTGIILIIISISFILSYFISLFTLSLPGINSFEYIHLIFNSSWQLYSMIILVGILILIPSFAFLFIGIKMIANKNILKVSVKAIITLSIIWLISLIMIIIMSITLVAPQYAETAKKTNKYILNAITSDTLSINMKEYQGKTIKTYYNFKEGIIGQNIEGISFTKDSVIKNLSNHLKIKPSVDSNFYLEIKSNATGNNTPNALKNLNDIYYKYQVKNNRELFLDSYLSFPKKDKFRNQDIVLILYVPENKYIKMEQNIEEIISANGNINIYHNNDINPNKIFKFVKGSLECMDCD